MATRRVSVVPHTHWDREWYAPFEYYRSRLGTVLSNGLNTLENDPRYAHFVLDGQMAAIDDYLHHVPADRERIVALVAAGRLTVGPWYVLMDEFLSSGETLIANLRLGRARARALGAEPLVGYLPDMFGHVAQMPQVLRLAGLDNPVLYRGVPDSVRATQFVWQSPDGSSVVTEYLANGYSNGARVPASGIELQSAINAFVDQSNVSFGSSVLWMVGTDHQAVDPALADRVDEANALDDRANQLVIESLADYLAHRRVDATTLTTVAGELRSAGRANLLSNCVSTHRGVRQLAQTAESAIENYARPLVALLRLAGHASPFVQSTLDEATQQVVLNSAHDSICACSHDDVVAAVATRFRSAATTALSISDVAMETLAPPNQSTQLTIFNPSPFARRAVVEIATDQPLPPSAQPLGSDDLADQTVLELTVSADDVAVVTRDLHTAEIVPGTWIQYASIDDSDGKLLRVHAVAGASANNKFDLETLKQSVRAWALQRTGSDAQVEFVVSRPVRRRALVLTPEIAPLSLAAVTLGSGDLNGDVLSVTTNSAASTATLSGAAATVTAEISTDSIGLSYNGQIYTLRIEAQSDVGDTYTFCPVLDETPSVATGWSPWQLIETGPLRAHLSSHAVVQLGKTQQSVTLSLRRCVDHDHVEIRVNLDNGMTDARLRLVVIDGATHDHSTADCVFGPVTRPASIEVGYEHPPATYPARAWVSSGATSLALPYMSEYEVLPDGSGIAVTLLRNTGWLSRTGLHNRPSAAGPEVPTPSAQQPGPHEISLALLNPEKTDDVDYRYRASRLLRLVPRVSAVTWTAPPRPTPLVAFADGASTVRTVAGLPRVTGAQLSAIIDRPELGGIEVRVFNPHDHTVDVEIDGIGDVIDLDDHVIGTWIGCAKLGAHKILTVLLRTQ